ncbi:MAG: 6-phosphofructokinase [Gammaproteobacteria bacterium]
MIDRDLSSGLAPGKEAVVAVEPTEPYWTENLLFALYDPKADIGFWLHLGSMPNDWGMWEDRVLGCLPTEGTLTMWAYHRPQQAMKPAGANLSFRCIEPFRRWRVDFDGYAQYVSDIAMQAGMAPDGLRRRLVIELDIDCATPVWDAHAAATSALGKGGMHSQNWAKEHYEQLYRARGRVLVDGEEIPFDGTGWRDHSRGPRGGPSGDPWGGHVIAGCLYPSGKAWIFSRYWKPDGTINLEGGCVVDGEGRFHFAEVVTAPRLSRLRMSGERLPIGLRWPGGALNLEMTTRRSILTSFQKKLAVGTDLEGPGLMYVLNFGPCEWDGEIGQVYIERSEALNLPPVNLVAPG